jgi:hypothetical protein
LPPKAPADLIVEVVLAEDPAARNVLPDEIEGFVKQSQMAAWGES